jgi:probable F420-dependent oxidoreductase
LQKVRLEFGFGIGANRLLEHPDDLAKVVRRADELGYFSVSFPEHILPPTEAGELLGNDHWPDGPTLAAFLAGVTTRIRFSMGVSVLPYHPPVQYAKQLATLDVVTKGRVILGVGTGWYEEEFEQLGIPFAERSAITDEYLRAILELWTSDSPTFSGRYVSFEDVSFYPKPVQKPIPIFVGGTGIRPARRAAELGAGWTPMVGTLEERREAFEQVRQLATERGRDPDTIWMTGNLSLDPDPDSGKAARHVAGGRYVHVVAGGGREQIIAAVEEHRAAGVDLLNVGLRWGTVGDLVAGLERFADEVIPAFR